MTIPVGSLTAFMSVKGAAQARADILGVRQAMSDAGASASASAAGFDRAEAGMAGAGRAAAAASTASNKLRAAQLDQVAAVERYNKVLADENASVAQLARAEAALIRANERVTASTPKVMGTSPFGAMAKDAEAASGSVSKFGGAMSSTLGMAKSLGLLVGGIELVKKAIDITKEANDFHRSMVLVQTNADVTAGEVNKASAALLQMAGPVAAAPADLATAWYHAKSVGLDYAKSLDTTRIAAEGSRVGNANLEETMNALTSTVASNIPGVKNMSSAMGQLIATVGSGDMKLSDLNEALGSGILSKAKIFGLSLTDVGAALATFGDLNIRGADAATTLRMAMEAMAKPAAGGLKYLDAWGLSATTLRKDMQEGGLNKAVIDLKNHLDAAGVTGDKVGGALLDAFGKKGASGITLLLANFDRLQSKFAILRDSGASFGEKWKATTETASFALASLGHTIEAAGISLTAKLGPSIASAATWLGTDVPHAIAQAQAALGPLEHEVGAVLVEAWHALTAVIGVAATALGAVGHVAAANSGVLTDLATATLALWAAFKGYEIAAVAFKAIQTGAVLSAVRVLELRDAFLAVAAGEKVMSAGAFVGSLAAIGVAAYAVGKGMSTLIESNNSFAHVMDNSANTAKTFTQALDESNGALTASVAKTVAAQLQSAGLADKAHAAGISLNQLTGAVTGTNAQYAALVETWRKGGDVSGDTITALGLMHAQYAKSAAGAQDLATVTGAAASATARQSAAAKAAAADEKAAAAATKDLTAALATLAQTQLASAQSEDQFLESIRGVTTSMKQNGTSLSENSAKGLANRDAFLSAMQAALSFKDAQVKAGTSTRTAADALASNVQQLENQAIKAGASKSAVRSLVAQMGLTPKDIRTKFDVDTRTPMQKLKAMQDLLNSIAGHTYTAHVTATGSVNIAGVSTGGTTFGGHYASGTGSGGLPNGYSWVGDPGPASELVHKSGSHVDVYSHSQSVGIARSLGMNTPSFASGTSGIEKGNLGGKTVYIYAGHDYSSLAAATNAVASATKSGAAAVTRTLKALETTQREYKFSYLPSFEKTLAGTTTALKNAGQSLLSHLAAADQADQVSSRLVGKIETENKQLDKLATARDSLADQLKAANKNLATVQKQFSDEQAAVAATMNSFNAATYQPPTSTSAAPITAALLQAEAAQTAAQTKADADLQAAQAAVTANTIGGDPVVAQLAAQAQASAAAAKAATDALTALQNAPATTVTDVVGGLQTAVATAKEFGQEIDKLKAEGLNSTTLKQVADAGPSAADLQALLAATPAQIKQINTLTAQLETTAGTVAKQVANDLYGAGVSAAEGLVKGLQSKEGLITKEMQTLADKMVAAIKSALHIKSPSQVMRGLGQFTGQGFALGITDTHKLVAASASKLANSAIPYPLTQRSKTPGQVGMDMSVVVDRLERIEAHLAVAPERIAAGVGNRFDDGLRVSDTRQQIMVQTKAGGGVGLR